MQEHVYLDFAASAPLDPAVAGLMDEVARMPGNPSSIHAQGRRLREAIDLARGRVAGLFGIPPASVVFTSGATEANATAIVGAWREARRRAPGRALRILTSSLEHASVRENVDALARDDGAIVDVLPVGPDGVVPADACAAAIGPDTAVVCMMWANNVLGTVQPVAAMGAAVAAARRSRGAQDPPITFICDAVQAAMQGIRPFEAGADVCAVSAHKMHGPKGVGAMLVRPGVALAPLIVGGGQEGGMRSGTENAAGIAGLGLAASLAASADRAAVASLAARLDAGLAALAPRVAVVGDPARLLPHVRFLRVRGAAGDVAAVRLDAAGFAVSAGSACDSGKRAAPGALRAVLGDGAAASGGVRVSFGRGTTPEDIDALLAALGDAVR